MIQQSFTLPLDCLCSVEQAIHRFAGKDLVASRPIVPTCDLERGEQAREFGNRHFLQKDGGGLADDGEFVVYGDAHGRAAGDEV